MVKVIHVLREEIDNLEAEMINVTSEWENLHNVMQYGSLADATDRFIELSLKQEILKNRLLVAQNRLEELRAANE